MKISKISESLLPKKVKLELHDVLTQMTNRRTYSVKNYEKYSEFKSKWIGRVGLKNQKGDVFAKLDDCRLFSDCYNGSIEGHSLISYKERVYRISNKTGNFQTTTKWYEPVEETLQESIKNISKILKQIKENFDNREVVKKEWYTMRGASSTQPKH